MFTAMGVGAYAAGAFHLMTHAFFKALLFLGSGSVIHAMAGEQDMRRMGNLRKYMPVTFATMFIGTLAIAGIPPFSGFFSKDEILGSAFEHNKAVWVIAAITALMTAFYMFRLISMTFFGTYRGPAWEAGHGQPAFAIPPTDRAKDITVAARHGAPHPTDPHAHGHGHEEDHEVAHGPAEPHDTDAAHAAHGGHGPWHGPHESPSAMTYPLMALAIGAIVAGFFGVPASLGGGDAIGKFLEPSFKAEHVEAARPEPREEAALSRGAEIGLMGFSVLLAAIGIGVAYRFYVTSPEVSERLAQNWSGAHRLLSNKYYVDELYDATVISGTMGGARGLWTFDRRVVDGVVNGSGRLTIVSSFFSGFTDKNVVDGLVNFVGWIVSESSLIFRRLQTGLVQNYAVLMLLGIFVFVSIYLIVR
jgi:NADH:ubiquinone oxidoreductase subunit 5 (subunit L)/multisubunit Na+/H+ antiporter MnhA subunit